VDAFRWEYGSIATGKGPLWGVPSSAQCAHMFFYNKTMFDGAGIPYPDETWDWSTLTETAKAFTKDENGDGVNETWGLNAQSSCYMMWWPSTWQAGGEWFDAEMKTCLADQEASMTGLKHVIDFFQTDKVAPLPGSMQSDPFMTGKVAMTFDGYWAATMTFPEIKEFDWDVAVPPRAPDKQPVIDLEEDAWSVMSGSKNIDAAWEFVKWLTTGEGGEYACQYINAGFPYKPIVNKYTYAKDRAIAPKSLWLYADLIDKGHTSYVAGGWGEFEGAASSELQAGVIGEKAAEDVAHDTVEKVNAILGDSWKKYVG
jgi:multiple sugar transport system substrate-binding protein